MRSKLLSHLRGVEQPTRASSGARDHDRDSISLGQRMQKPSIQMSSRTRQLPGCLIKSSLDPERRSHRLVRNSLRRALKLAYRRFRKNFRKSYRS